MSTDGAIVNYADKENVDLIVVGTKEVAWKYCVRCCNTCIMSGACCKITNLIIS
jgi:hypothetical protein